jgi:hypothetical protein
VRIDRQFAEAGYTLRQLGLKVSLTEDRSVMAGIAGYVDLVLAEGGHIAAQPSRLDFPLLSEHSRPDRQKYHDEFLHFRELHPIRSTFPISANYIRLDATGFVSLQFLSC